MEVRAQKDDRSMVFFGEEEETGGWDVINRESRSVIRA